MRARTAGGFTILSGTMATDADGRSLPECVAGQPWRDDLGHVHVPPKPAKPYRGADHIRCSHPTPLPQGYHPCQGDTGCPVRLKRRVYCPYHEDLIYDLEPHRLYEALTGLPRLPARAPWAQ